MDIYVIDNRETARLPEELFRRLFPQRMKRYDRCRREEDRLMGAGAGLLIAGIAGIREEELRLSSGGKPYRPGGPCFSVTHSGGCAAIAVGSAAVGLDMEQIREQNLTAADYVLTEKERQWMQEEPAVRFHLLWSLKESIMKATGQGLQLPPSSLDIHPDGNCLTVDGVTYYYGCTVWKHYSAACAAVTPVGTLHIRSLTARDILTVLQGGTLP